MKNLFLTIAFFALSSMSVSANEEIDLLVKKDEETVRGGLRSAQPDVYASIDNSVVEINIDGYDGSVSVNIYDNTGLIVRTVSDLVMGHAVISLNMSGLTTGIYTIYVFINDISYEGVFLI